MATKEDKRQKFINLLHQLFQLDQPDLDFGFYRIMHAKAGQVTKFLEEDLLSIIQEAFGEADEARIAEAKAAYDAARKQAADYGAPESPLFRARDGWESGTLCSPIGRPRGLPALGQPRPVLHQNIRVPDELHLRSDPGEGVQSPARHPF